VKARVQRAADTLRHRGPDAERVQVVAGTSGRARLGFGHRRLAIVDLSPEGVQPMPSASGRYLICFNGEIYNHAELRERLELDQRAPKWRGHSDTEVLLAAIEAWGIEASIDASVGMFAIALWDAVEEKLHLIRDRLGIKPLFVAQLPDGMAFASEVRAFESDARFDRALNPIAIEDVLRVGYVGAGRSIYQAVHQIDPGTHVVFDRADAGAGRARTYWDIESVIQDGQAHPFVGSEEEAVEAVEASIKEAVRLRMLADVNVGAFLSGGIDSSAVTALMQAQSSGQVRTYSIGNVTAAYDESSHAEAVAKHLGTKHTTFRVTGEEAAAVVPMLATMYDEPFADVSQVPTYLVSKLARAEVTVALSGDGGDEVFGGYNRHVFAPPLWRAGSMLPGRVRRKVSTLLQRPTEDEWDRRVGAVGLGRAVRMPGQKVHKLARSIGAADERAFYDSLRSLWPGELPVLHRTERPSPRHIAAPTFAERMMAGDLVDYLPGDILTKVDRASMAVALEARVPLLDHRVVELAWRLPMSMKIKGRVGKRVLRQVLARHVPTELFDRPKMGFGVPLGDWLRGPLKQWATDTIDCSTPTLGLAVVRIRQALAEHQREGGREDVLWPALMLSAWAGARRPLPPDA
jgi:asparagine synthase (glutamine-hydrolysing)